MPKAVRGCRASAAVSGRVRPSTRSFAAFWRRASPLSTASWLCGAVNFSVARALPMSLPVAWARRPRLATGSELALRWAAVRSVCAIVASHASSMPSSRPSTTPCHLSGRFAAVPAVMSIVVHVRRGDSAFSEQACRLRVGADVEESLFPEQQYDGLLDVHLMV